MILIQYCYTIILPESFGLNHKRRKVHDHSTQYELEGIFETYELDTHVEIVFLGDFDITNLQKIQSSLEHLSRLSVIGSPLSHTHEKFVYHTSTSNTLSNEINEVIKNSNPVNPKIIEEKLVAYHRRSHAMTTIFVLNYYDLANNRPYSYISLPPSSSSSDSDFDEEMDDSTCSRRAFVSRGVDAVAWVDLNAEAVLDGSEMSNTTPTTSTIISSTNSGTLINYLPPPDLFKNGDEQKHERVKPQALYLASFLHRSVESLVSFPRLHEGTNKSSVTSIGAEYDFTGMNDVASSDRILQLAVITICGDPSLMAESSNNGECRVDEHVMNAITALASSIEATGTFRRVVTSKAQTVLETDEALLHAIHAATVSKSQGSRIDDLFSASDANTDVLDALFSNSEYPKTQEQAEILLDPHILSAWWGSIQVMSNFVGTDATTMNMGSARSNNGIQVLPIFILQPPSSVKGLVGGSNIANIELKIPPRTKGSNNNSRKPYGAKTKPQTRPHSISSLDPNSKVERVKGVLVLSRHGKVIGEELTGNNDGSACNARYRGQSLSSLVVEYVLQLLWGDCTPTVTYSTSSRSLVRDLLWAEAMPVVSTTSKDKDVDPEALLPFTVTRCMQRRSVMAWMESLLLRMTSLIQEVGLMVPRVDTMILMGDKLSYDETDKSANRDGKDDKKSKSNKKGKTPAMDFSSVRKITSEDDVDTDTYTSDATGLLQRFANSLHEAATEWSHTEFSSVRVYLSNAETILREAQGRLEKVSRSRRGTLACEHDEPSKEEGEGDGDGNEGSDNNKKNQNQNQNQHGDQFDYTLSWSPIFISAVIGVALGYFHSTQPTKRRI